MRFLKKYFILSCALILISGILTFPYIWKLDCFQKMGGRELIAVVERYNLREQYYDFKIDIGRGRFSYLGIIIFKTGLSLADLLNYDFDKVVSLESPFFLSDDLNRHQLRIKVLRGEEGEMKIASTQHESHFGTLLEGRLERVGEGLFIFTRETGSSYLFRVVEGRIIMEGWISAPYQKDHPDILSRYLKAFQDFPPDYSVSSFIYLSSLISRYRHHFLKIFDFSEFKERFLKMPRENRYPSAFTGAISLNPIFWSFLVVILPIRLLIPVYILILFILILFLILNFKAYSLWIKKSPLYFLGITGFITIVFAVVITITSIRSLFYLFIFGSIYYLFYRFTPFLIPILMFLWLLVYFFFPDLEV